MWGARSVLNVTAVMAGLAAVPGVGVSRLNEAVGQRMQRTPDIHYVPTPQKVVDAMLTLAGVGPKDLVYDLGSGDGRIVIAAARRGARGVGIELEPALVAEASRNAKKAGVLDRVQFIEGDIFTADLSEASVVTLYLLSSINERLRPKLLRELKPGSRIVSHRFPMGDWVAEKKLTIAGADILLWRVPAR
jgi:SAM-dependent methyltransferase